MRLISCFMTPFSRSTRDRRRVEESFASWSPTYSDILPFGNVSSPDIRGISDVPVPLEGSPSGCSRAKNQSLHRTAPRRPEPFETEVCHGLCSAIDASPSCSASGPVDPPFASTICRSSSTDPQTSGRAVQAAQYPRYETCGSGQVHASGLIFDVLPGDFLAPLSGCTDKVRPGPEGRESMQVVEFVSEDVSTGSLESVNDLVRRMTSVCLYEELDMVRPDRQRIDLPVVLFGHFMKDLFQAVRHRPFKHTRSPFHAPHEVIRHRVDGVATFSVRFFLDWHILTNRIPCLVFGERSLTLHCVRRLTAKTSHCEALVDQFNTEFFHARNVLFVVGHDVVTTRSHGDLQYHLVI